MPVTSSYRIVGFDPERPPKIETFPCIYLFFKLDDEPPPAWCNELAQLVEKSPYPVEMDKEDKSIVKTWVRKPDEIEGMLEKLKIYIAACNTAYDRLVNAPTMTDSGEEKKIVLSPDQIYLNEIVARLNFD